ncbi:MAG: hypothetical protein ACJAYG_002705, partial [Oceanicoccus sp.]
MKHIKRLRDLRLISLSSALLLAACTGGGGDSTTISTTDKVDPVTVTVPIAFVQKPLPDTPPSLRGPNDFSPGAKLFIRNPSGVSGEEVLLNDKILTIVAAELLVDISELEIDIKDLETSYDGKTLLFAARVVPVPIDTNLEFTTWNLWQYHFETEAAEYIIPSALIRNEGVEYGSAQDTAPHFLTDDRIVFSSTRQFIEQGNQLDEGRGQIYSSFAQGRQEPSSVLHIFDPESQLDAIAQISFNRSHDIDPIVRQSGEIVYSRWVNTSGNDQFSLFRINPSGRHSSYLYGHHSGDSGSLDTKIEYTQVRELNDGRLAAIIKTESSPTLGGELVIIDTDNYSENQQGTWQDITLSGNAQNSLTNIPANTDELRSEGGQFTAFYPLNDDSGRILISWSPCRVLVDTIPAPCNAVPQAVEEVLAAPIYGVWIYDLTNNTQQPVVIGQENFYISEIVAGTQRPFPLIADELGDVDTNLAIENKGMLLIDSIYDIDGVDTSPMGIANHALPGSIDYSDRPVRFMRITKPIQETFDEILDPPGFAFGIAGQPMREILGYATVEPDGSVAVAVPANTTFTFSFLDAQGRKISNRRHNYWLQVAPGEILHCTGCHTSDSTLAHGRTDSRPAPANSGASNLGSSLGYPNTNSSLFASAENLTMAQIYLEHNPARALSLDLIYSDEWTDTAQDTPDPTFDFSYPSDWTDGDSSPAGVDNIPVGKSMVVESLDSDKDSRIVINYADHIQPIWDRERVDSLTNTVSCSGCHQAITGAVPP